ARRGLVVVGTRTLLLRLRHAEPEPARRAHLRDHPSPGAADHVCAARLLSRLERRARTPGAVGREHSARLSDAYIFAVPMSAAGSCASRIGLGLFRRGKRAAVAEPVDAMPSKGIVRKGVGVRAPPAAWKKPCICGVFSCLGADRAVCRPCAHYSHVRTMHT